MISLRNLPILYVLRLEKIPDSCKERLLNNKCKRMEYGKCKICTRGIAVAMLLVISCSDCIFFSEKERQQCNVFETCGCLWAYLTDLRTLEGGSHVHYNPFYDPLKHSGPLLPPAAALAPTLWPQFHLRWACPEEAQAGEIEPQCRKIIMKNSEMQKVVIFLNFLNFTTFHLKAIAFLHLWMAITHFNSPCLYVLNFGRTLCIFL